MALKLYEEAGWLNIPEIAKQPFNFVDIIGPRQCGKTWGTLKYMIENHKTFIFSRTTPSDLDFALTDSTSVFTDLALDLGYKFEFERANQYITDMYCWYPGETERTYIGIAVAITSLSHIRGFSGQKFTDWVWDEFIAEISQKRITHLGDAFINGYITINGNRELNGKPPLRVWLLANANTLDSQVLAQQRLTHKVEQMSATGQEYSLMQDRGVLVILPHANEITSKRAATALYKMTGTESNVAKMALNNEFSYNDFTDIMSLPLEPMVCVIERYGHYIYRSKENGRYYCCSIKKGSPLKCKNIGTKGFRKFCKNNGFESFLNDMLMQRVVFCNYEEKIFWCDIVNGN